MVHKRINILIAALAFLGSLGCVADDPRAAPSGEASSGASSTSQPETRSESQVPRSADDVQPVAVGGLEFEPACEPEPADQPAEFFFADLLTVGGGTRVSPEDPDFPTDYCPGNAVFAVVGGGGARGTSTLGEWTWPGRGWCALPGSVLWSHHEFTTERGVINVLEETHILFPDGCGPGTPCSDLLSFSGKFTVLGGTGAYQGATGTWQLVGRQRGDGTTAGVLCGWLKGEGI